MKKISFVPRTMHVLLKSLRHGKKKSGIYFNVYVFTGKKPVVKIDTVSIKFFFEQILFGLGSIIDPNSLIFVT